MNVKEMITLVYDTYKKDLCEKKEDLKKKHSWNNDDARIAIFSKCINATDCTFLLLKFQTQHLTSRNWWKSNTTFSESEMKNLIYEYKKFVKTSFFNSNFFCIESSLRTILRAIDPEACNKGTAEFASIYETLLKRTDLQKNTNIFKLMRLLRNTFHNNTFYFHKSGENDSVIFKEKEYKFEIGKPVDFITWDFLIDAYMEYLIAIKEIMESEEVRSMKEIIDPGIMTKYVPSS